MWETDGEKPGGGGMEKKISLEENSNQKEIWIETRVKYPDWGTAARDWRTKIRK